MFTALRLSQLKCFHFVLLLTKPSWGINTEHLNNNFQLIAVRGNSNPL